MKELIMSVLEDVNHSSSLSDTRQILSQVKPTQILYPRTQEPTQCDSDSETTNSDGSEFQKFF